MSTLGINGNYHAALTQIRYLILRINTENEISKGSDRGSSVEINNMISLTETSVSMKSNSTAHVYSIVWKFLKFVNLLRKMSNM